MSSIKSKNKSDVNKIIKGDLDLRNAKPAPSGKEYSMRHATGLICRVLPGGKKVLGWRCKDLMRGHKQTRINYGDYPDLSLANAKDIHTLFQSARRNGADIRDPEVLTSIIRQVTNKDRGVIQKEGLTFSELVELFFREYVDANNKYHGPYNRIKNHLLPVLKDHYVEQINEETIRSVIDQLKKSGKTERTLVDTFDYASQMFEFAITMGKVRKNPFEKNPFRRVRRNDPLSMVCRR